MGSAQRVDSLWCHHLREGAHDARAALLSPNRCTSTLWKPRSSCDARQLCNYQLVNGLAWFLSHYLSLPFVSSIQRVHSNHTPVTLLSELSIQPYRNLTQAHTPPCIIFTLQRQCAPDPDPIVHGGEGDLGLQN